MTEFTVSPSYSPPNLLSMLSYSALCGESWPEWTTTPAFLALWKSRWMEGTSRRWAWRDSDWGISSSHPCFDTASRAAVVSFPDFSSGWVASSPNFLPSLSSGHYFSLFSLSSRENKVFLWLLVAEESQQPLFALNAVHISVRSPFIQVSSVEPSEMNSALCWDPNW